MSRLDLIVIGAGSAGISAAHAARRSGAKVAIVESDRLGGECPNYDCNPSKTLLRSARIYSYLKRAGEFGLNVGGISFDWKKIAARRDHIIELITQGGKRYEEQFARAGIALVRGVARFVSEHTVEVGGRRLTAAGLCWPRDLAQRSPWWRSWTG